MRELPTFPAVTCVTPAAFASSPTHLRLSPCIANSRCSVPRNWSPKFSSTNAVASEMAAASAAGAMPEAHVHVCHATVIGRSLLALASHTTIHRGVFQLSTSPVSVAPFSAAEGS
ncbi:hypothetical protein BDA96_02G216500 [Sorghum bicolor]|uniref:Uncharacterized protein n=2 Tax=Sorghum bicolor TaxID=4558 RepID=A0A921RRG7_SORBI|nr:hypothetical protein BDA96_02G216500 [Sorghum bicolor]KXG35652.1 hypothetical protein SORBI_3002G205800 [Sorghum bicolor]